ncbi:MAG: cell division protein FtsB [Gammaproteobacteria bacterium]|nr:cell division protein FtsB [Gammaproteobacteria bacterium]
MRILIAVLIGLLAIVQYRLWVGDEGMAGLWRLEQTVAEQKKENQALRERNAQLAAEVEDLKTGLAAIEDRARSELGMVHEDETYYQIVDR